VGIQGTISQEQQLIGSLEGFELKLNTIFQGRCKVLLRKSKQKLEDF